MQRLHFGSQSSQTSSLQPSNRSLACKPSYYDSDHTKCQEFVDSIAVILTWYERLKVLKPLTTAKNTLPSGVLLQNSMAKSHSSHSLT